MGLWGIVKDAAIEATEQVHAERLHHDLGVTMRLVEGLPEELRAQTLAKFVEMRRQVSRDMRNWSPDGALTMAKSCLAKAREKQHLNRKESLALAMIGLWLESGLRNHPKAYTVHKYFDGLATQLEDAMSQDHSEPSNDDTDLATKVAMLMRGMVDGNPNAIDADEFPNGKGQFGYSPDNPIPCCTIVGSQAYLKELRLRGGPVAFTRMGSFNSRVSANPVDGYQLSVDGTDVCAPIYISPYEKRNSNRAPLGLTLRNLPRRSR